MKTLLHTLTIAALLILGACGKNDSDNKQPPEAGNVPAVTAEVSPDVMDAGKAALEKGIKFLLDKQLPDGSWLQDPAITALACTALHNSESETYEKQISDAIEKGRKVILKKVQDDGSFLGSQPNYVNYTTATCLSALAAIDDPRDREIMRQARHFLIDLQLDEDNEKKPTSKDNPFHGGIGYGSGGPTVPDLSNTQMALEALYATEYLDTEAGGGTPEDAAKAKACWENAIGFLKNVQNIPDDAGENWAVPESPDGDADGGFFYHPEQSKASEKFDDATTLRSYGSMTYAGLKSMLYAQLKKDDYRVEAATEWARRHYTLDENPGMGAEGHYYYLMMFAKAHAALGEDIVTTIEGRKHNWREDLINKLVETQNPDGSWVNDEHGRWMESLRELITAYSLISLEFALAE